MVKCSNCYSTKVLLEFALNYWINNWWGIKSIKYYHSYESYCLETKEESQICEKLLHFQKTKMRKGKMLFKALKFHVFYSGRDNCKHTALLVELSVFIWNMSSCKGMLYACSSFPSLVIPWGFFFIPEKVYIRQSWKNWSRRWSSE